MYNLVTSKPQEGWSGQPKCSFKYTTLSVVPGYGVRGTESQVVENTVCGENGAWGPFLERPGNLTGPKSYFEMKVSSKEVSVMTSNEVHFVSLANNFTAQFSNLLKLPSGVENSLTGPVITGSFEKLTPGEKHGVWWKPRGLSGKHGA